jgi:hypothetical protein
VGADVRYLVTRECTTITWAKTASCSLSNSSTTDDSKPTLSLAILGCDVCTFGRRTISFHQTPLGIYLGHNPMGSKQIATQRNLKMTSHSQQLLRHSLEEDTTRPVLVRSASVSSKPFFSVSALSTIWHDENNAHRMRMAYSTPSQRFCWLAVSTQKKARNIRSPLHLAQHEHVRQRVAQHKAQDHSVLLGAFKNKQTTLVQKYAIKES